MAKITLDLTLEEAMLLVPVLRAIHSDRPAFSDQRTKLLTHRVAERIASSVDDAEMMRARFVRENGVQREREVECPHHRELLRLDKDTIGSMLEVFYCPRKGCEFMVEVGR